MRSKIASVVVLSLLLADSSNGIDVDISDPGSISAAAKIIASSVVDMYKGNETGGIPGLFPAPYSWWESGLAFDSLLEYWALTGDDTHNDLVLEALLWQVGPDKNYMPTNQTNDLSNEDQSTWALTCMNAAEHNFPTAPASTGVGSWVSLAQNVFDDQVARWDDTVCSGGLHWQISTLNAGYNYKNAASNGNFLQLAARLARYTGNQTYNQWALRTLNWSFDIGLIANSTLSVYDGTDTTTGCSNIDRIRWTSNIGTYMSGVAYMHNLTGTRSWASGPGLFLNANSTFASTPKDIITEVACAKADSCNIDELAFRAVLARALANTRNLLAPGEGSETSRIDILLRTSAEGAAAQCSGGQNGTACGSDWSTSKWDGTQGLGQSLSALEILLGNMPAAQLRTENATASSSTTTVPGTPSATASGGPGASSTSNVGVKSVSRSFSGLLVAFSFALILCT